MLSAVRLRERGPMLRPVDEILRRRDGEARDVAVPLRVREDVGPVVGLDDAGIFDEGDNRYPNVDEARVVIPKPRNKVTP